MGEIAVKHTFYYSKSQDELLKSIEYLEVVGDSKDTYITNDDGELIKYSQWCSTPNGKCNWNDAVIVCEIYATESEVLRRIVRK